LNGGVKTVTKTLITKNRRTKKAETIIQRELTLVDWGFHFFVDSEIEAYKAAYVYRHSPHGVKVEFAAGVQQWMVTVFNSTAVNSGIDGARNAA
jgi:hypothetical protein